MTAVRPQPVALMVLVGAFAAGTVCGATIGAPGALADAAGTTTRTAAAAPATHDAARPARATASLTSSSRTGTPHRRAGDAARRARPAVPLSVRFPTVTGQTIAPGRKVLSTIAATLPLPAGSGVGRRIVYGASAQHLWIVDGRGTVVRDYPVTGRADRPGPGRYRIYSKSPTSSNPVAEVTFAHMVRFAHGVTGAAIGFHDIPRWGNGAVLQTPESLGLALGRGGCIRQTDENARFLYRWARVGDRVVVVK